MARFEGHPSCRGAGSWAGPSYDEENVSDKPMFVRARASLRSPGYPLRDRCEAALTVDWVAQRVLGALEEAGRLEDTLMVFSADNGMLMGEHRLLSKGYPYSTPVPLYLWWPERWGSTGRSIDEPVQNVDLAPTLLDAAGTTADIPVDGRSILPFARAPGLRSGRPILHEGLIPGDIDRDGTKRPGSTVGVYYAIRTSRYLYVRWKGGVRELYDRRRDPQELDSRHADPRYRRVVRLLGDELQGLRRCSGSECGREAQALDARVAQARR